MRATQTWRTGVMATIVVVGGATSGASAGEPCCDRTLRDLMTMHAQRSNRGNVLDPAAFFEGLVERYRCLTTYEDVVHMVQVTERTGKEASRTETEMHVHLSDGELEVETPGSQLLSVVRSAVPIRTTEPVEDAKMKRNLWLAPHMTLKFAEQPLDDLRPGSEGSFTPVEVESVTVNEKAMVELELKTGDPASEHGQTRCNLLVNPDSMLIEKMQFRQQMADGSMQETSLDIRPVQAIDEVEPSAQADDSVSASDGSEATIPGRGHGESQGLATFGR